MTDACAYCGAPRRTDGLVFCDKCGAVYPVVAHQDTSPRVPRVFSHPWLLFVAAGALSGVVLAWVVSETRTVIGPWSSSNRFAFMIFWVGAWGLFWLPTVIAVLRRRQPVWTVALVNLIFGLSIGGWIVALSKASSGRTYQKQSLA